MFNSIKGEPYKAKKKVNYNKITIINYSTNEAEVVDLADYLNSFATSSEFKNNTFQDFSNFEKELKENVVNEINIQNLTKTNNENTDLEQKAKKLKMLYESVLKEKKESEK